MAAALRLGAPCFPMKFRRNKKQLLLLLLVLLKSFDEDCFLFLFLFSLFCRRWNIRRANNVSLESVERASFFYLLSIYFSIVVCLILLGNVRRIVSPPASRAVASTIDRRRLI
jgi:hypothetical protein